MERRFDDSLVKMEDPIADNVYEINMTHFDFDKLEENMDETLLLAPPSEAMKLPELTIPTYGVAEEDEERHLRAQQQQHAPAQPPPQPQETVSTHVEQSSTKPAARPNGHPPGPTLEALKRRVASSLGVEVAERLITDKTWRVHHTPSGTFSHIERKIIGLDEQRHKVQRFRSMRAACESLVAATTPALSKRAGKGGRKLPRVNALETSFSIQELMELPPPPPPPRLPPPPPAAASPAPSSSGAEANPAVAAKFKRHKPTPAAARPVKPPKWIEDVKSRTPVEYRDAVDQYIEKGYCVWKRALPADLIATLLEGPSAPGPDALDSSAAAPDRVLRTRGATQVWRGARLTMEGFLENNRGPVVSRCEGRYDMRLPEEHLNVVNSALEASGVSEIIKALIPRARIRASDVMLSRPGSHRQPVHVDSCWEGRKSKTPVPHYATILIPLTEQDAQTGGTRVWPGTHRDSELEISDQDPSTYVDTIAPMLLPGDALIFDGLLAHCGMENVSKSRDRYFFYMAWSTKPDPNVDVTG